MNTIVVGLNFGDEGKGSIVNFLTKEKPSTLVCRFNGGCQAAHNVVNNGRHHTFSQFGSGTFNGCPTYLDRDVIIDPIAMYYESLHIQDLRPTLFIHEDCLVTTGFHRAANRIIDGINKHGSCGLGIGLTREMWSQTGDGLLVSDLWCPPVVRRKLNWIRQWCQDKISYYAYNGDSITQPLDLGVNEVYHDLRKYREKINIQLCYDSIISKYPDVVFEGAQGLHLDEVYGTIPHTTYSDTTPRRAVELCRELNHDYEILGVTRTYETRHGNGPMFNEWNSGAYRKKLESDHNWNNGSFSGNFRGGFLDHDWVNEACNICDIDHLAINHIDQVDYVNLFRCPVKIEGFGPEDKRINNGVAS